MAIPIVSEVRRFDKVDNSPSIRMTDEGFLLARGTFAKVGILRYDMPDGTVRRELVREEDLFAADSIETCALLPVTNGHPQERDGFVYPENCQRLSIGMTGETPTREDGSLVGSIKITSAVGIQAVNDGRQQLSLGYKCEVVMDPGEWNGNQYDGYQRNRRYNHLALVDTARAGADARINLDGDSEMPEDLKLVPVRLDGGLTYQSAPEVAQALAKATADAESLRARLDEANAKLTEQTKRADSAEAKLSDPATVANLVAARLRIERFAAKVLDRATFDGMSNAALITAAVKARHPSAPLDGKSETYLSARFDAMAEDMEEDEKKDEDDEDEEKDDKNCDYKKKDRKKDGMASQRTAANGTKMDGSNSDPVLAAHNRMIDNLRNPKKGA